jgi:hypothetical protein
MFSGARSGNGQAYGRQFSALLQPCWPGHNQGFGLRRLTLREDLGRQRWDRNHALGQFGTRIGGQLESLNGFALILRDIGPPIVIATEHGPLQTLLGVLVPV